MKRAWYLNFDAERELARPRGYRAPKALEAQMRDRAALAASLCQGEPIVPLYAKARPANIPQGTPVCVWCPTPTALAALGRQKLRPPSAPPLSVLQRVNHRRYQHEVALSMASVVSSGFGAETRFVDGTIYSAEQLESLFDLLSGKPRLGRGWHLERPYGFAGKGSRRITRALDHDDKRWISESLRQGGVLVEPWVDIRREWSMHGWVDDAALWIGRPCRQECDAHGAPVRIELALDEKSLVWNEYVDVLGKSANLVGLELRKAGYFGPFGIDGFSWSHGGEERFHPLSDLNARFTIGWSLGMGALREAALQRYFAAA